MTDRRPSLRARALAGEPLLGCLVSHDAPWLVDMLALVGFDFVTLDLEHEPVALDEAARFIRACDSAGIASVIRIPLSEALQTVLNFGASAVQVPDVRTAADAERLQRISRFYPLGERGFTTSVRDAGYGLAGDARTYMAAANERTLVIAMIESLQAVEELDGIASVEGIDMLYVGPNDLAQSMGFPPKTEVDAVVESVISRLATAGRRMGLGLYQSPTAERLAADLGQGVSLFTIPLAKEIAAQLRGLHARMRGPLTEAAALHAAVSAPDVTGAGQAMAGTR